MQSGKIRHVKGRVHFHKIGNGSELLIAFHGFKDQGADFKVCENARFTIIAIDLPFHGQTKWETDYYNQKDIADIVDAICEMEQHRTFSLIGFSLGGRIAIGILDLIKDRLQTLYLLAPDGLRTKGMGIPEKLPVGVRRKVKQLLRNPKGFLKLVSFLNRCGLVDHFSSKYIHYHLQDEKRQRRLFNTWISTSKFEWRISEASAIIQKKIFKTILVAGESDPIISLDRMRDFAVELADVEFIVVPKGHHLLDEKTAERIFQPGKTIKD